MNRILMRSWWWMALRGLLLLGLGLAAALWPGMTLNILVALFAVYALLYGAVWMAAAVRYWSPGWAGWMAMLPGALSIAAGVGALCYPAMALLVLVVLIGAHALIAGVADLMLAIRLRRVLEREWLLVCSGLGSALFGLVVLLYPDGAGLTVLALLLSLYAAVTGVILMVLALRLRAWSRLHHGRSSPAAGLR